MKVGNRPKIEKQVYLARPPITLVVNGRIVSLREKFGVEEVSKFMIIGESCINT